MDEIILASASPRRRELLKMIVPDFRVIPSYIEEKVPDGLPAYEHAEFLAKIKAQDVALKHPDSVVIGADTCVIASGKVLGKPAGREDAYRMITLLSGNTHRVITGCCIVKGKSQLTFSVTTQVKFIDIDKEDIEAYIDTQEPYDKAGGYGIQGRAGLFVEEITGDYFNVVGLPVCKLNIMLKKFLKCAKEV